MSKSLFQLGEIAFYSPLVIAARMGTLAGTGAARDREARRMVSEKVAAASVSAVHTALEMQKQAVLAGFALAGMKASDPARAAEKIAQAAVKPVARKVKANSRRLSRAKKR